MIHRLLLDCLHACMHVSRDVQRIIIMAGTFSHLGAFSSSLLHLMFVFSSSLHHMPRYFLHITSRVHRSGPTKIQQRVATGESLINETGGTQKLPSIFHGSGFEVILVLELELQPDHYKYYFHYQHLLLHHHHTSLATRISPG